MKGSVSPQAGGDSSDKQFGILVTGDNFMILRNWTNIGKTERSRAARKTNVLKEAINKVWPVFVPAGGSETTRLMGSEENGPGQPNVGREVSPRRI